jgi:4-amino-4-deoxy-L-arabinose transferase-like glycosyltransferase
MKKKLGKYLLVLLFIILFNLFNNIYFLNEDEIPLFADTGSFYEESKYIYNQFENNVPKIINLYIFFPDSPLIYYPSFILYPFFGISEDVASFQGTVFLIILIIATYLLGKELFNKDVGLLAAVFVSFSQHITGMSRVPFGDIAFSAMFTLTLYFFLKSKKFSDIKYTWFFNISLALTFLSKFNSIPSIIIIIFIYLFINLLFNKKDFRNYFSKWKKININNFLLSSFFIFLPIFHYISSYQKSLHHVFYSFGIKEYSSTTLMKIFISYFSGLAIIFEYSFIFVIFIVSLVFFFLFSKKNKILVFSLMIGASIYQISIIYIFPYNNLVDLPRYLLFMKPVYFIIISYFLILFLYKSMSLYLVNRNIRSINNENYIIFISIVFIFLLIPTTLLFNYTNLMPEPEDIPPLFIKYQPTLINYNIVNLSGSMFYENKDFNVFLFVPMNHFISLFNSHVIENYSNVRITTIWLDKKNIELRDGFNLPINETIDSFTDPVLLKECMTNFDYILIPSNIKREYLGDYPLYHEKIFPFLYTSTYFDIFEIVRLNDLNTSILIFKNNNVN